MRSAIGFTSDGPQLWTRVGALVRFCDLRMNGARLEGPLGVSIHADQVIVAHNEIPHAVIGKPWMALSLRSSQVMGSHSWSLGIEAKPDRLKNGTSS